MSNEKVIKSPASPDTNGEDDHLLDDDLRKYLKKSLMGNPDADEISRSSFRSQQSREKQQNEQEDHEAQPFDEQQSHLQDTEPDVEHGMETTQTDFYEAAEEESARGIEKPYNDDLQKYLDKTPSERQAWLLERQEQMLSSSERDGKIQRTQNDTLTSNFSQRNMERQGESFPTTTEGSDTEEYPTDIEMLDREYPSDVNSMTDHPEQKQKRKPSIEEGDFDVEEDLEVSSYGDFESSDIENSMHSNNPKAFDKQESWLQDVVGTAGKNNKQDQNEQDMEQATSANNNDDKSSMDGTQQHENKHSRRSSQLSLLSETTACWSPATKRLVFTGLCIALGAALVVVVVAVTAGFSSDATTSSRDANVSSSDYPDDTWPNVNVTMVPTVATPPTLPPLPPNCPPDVDDVSILGNQQYNCAWLRRQSVSVIVEMCSIYPEISPSCRTTCRNCTSADALTTPPTEITSDLPTRAPTLSPTAAKEALMTQAPNVTDSPTTKSPSALLCEPDFDGPIPNVTSTQTCAWLAQTNPWYRRAQCQPGRPAFIHCQTTCQSCVDE